MIKKYLVHCGGNKKACQVRASLMGVNISAIEYGSDNLLANSSTTNETDVIYSIAAQFGAIVRAYQWNSPDAEDGTG